jgi:arylesterase/paraoxonase
VVYYDGSGFVEAATGIAYANGINVSPDGRLLYVCAATEGALHIYDRDSLSGRLEHRDEIDLDTGVDNIEIEPDGDLWIAAHPQLLTFVEHAEDHWTVSPSQVLRLTPRKVGGYEVEEVYLDTGEQISASSVAAARGNRLLIGAVFDSKFLDCRR